MKLSPADAIGGCVLGVVGLALSTVTAAVHSDVGESAAFPVGFAAAALALVALDLASRRTRRTRYRIALVWSMAGVLLGLAGWGLRVIRVVGSSEGRIVRLHVPPFGAATWSTHRPAPAAPAPAAAPETGLRVGGAYAIDALGQRWDVPRVGRLEALGAHLDVTGAAVTDGKAHLAFGWELVGPDGRVVTARPLPAAPADVPGFAAPYGTAGFHALAWPGLDLGAGRYRFRFTAWDATRGDRVTVEVPLDYDWTPPGPAQRASGLVFTQPDHAERAQPGATYRSGDTVHYDVQLYCPRPACHYAVRQTLEPLAPTPGFAAARPLPSPTCAPSRPPATCDATYYVTGLPVGRYHLVVDFGDDGPGAAGATTGQVAGDFAVLPKENAPPRDAGEPGPPR